MQLPVTYLDGFNLGIEDARNIGRELSDTFRVAEPYPHVVIDDFLPMDVVTRLCQAFPDAVEVDHELYNIGYRGSMKRQYSPENCGTYARHFFHFLNSAPFLEFIGGVCGITGILGDPYFEGGGFHETMMGGKLGIHRDFRIQKRLALLRRLNFILYLNEDWKTEFGGELELWNRDMSCRVKKVAPIVNRCVIFATDDRSFHGHPEPLNCPPNRSRRSVAAYYYTASEKIWNEVPSRRTHFVARPEEDAGVRDELRRVQIEPET